MNKFFSPARVLVLGFMAVIIVGTLLLMLPQASFREGGIGFLDALFTATSAVCVTGLVVVDTGTTFTTLGQVIILGLIQIGGLGFMTMATLIFMLLGKKIGYKNRLLLQESLNHLTVGGVVRLVRIVFLYTVIVEGIGALLLGIRFSLQMGFARGMYYGLFHSISAFCNAGFDIMGNYTSLTAYRGDPFVSLVVMTLFILGGLGFSVALDIVGNWRKPSRLSFHSKLVLLITALLLVLAFIGIFAMEYTNPATLAGLPWWEKILSTAFTAAAPRTAGFNTLPTDGLRQPTLFFIILLMFVGASPASTGGGIKTTTVGVVLIAVASMIRGQEDAVLFRRRLPQYIIHKSLSIILIGLALVVTVTMVLSITEPQGFLEVMFETISAFGTVGLSTGITPELSTLGRILIIITMFAGRVGPVTLTLAFARRLTASSKIRYPEERVMVG